MALVCMTNVILDIGKNGMSVCHQWSSDIIIIKHIKGTMTHSTYSMESKWTSNLIDRPIYC